MLDDRPGHPEKRCWVCPVALLAHKKGLLGKPGKKHQRVIIYTLEKQ